MYILDTNVVSELRKVATGRADAAVAGWVRETSESLLFLSVVTVLEIEIGALAMERRDKAQGLRLRRWLENTVLQEFERRVLLVDMTVARRCAALHVPNRRPDRDAFIAGTALVHNMTVVTRNTADFEGTGARLLNPWQA